MFNEIFQIYSLLDVLNGMLHSVEDFLFIMRWLRLFFYILDNLNSTNGVGLSSLILLAHDDDNNGWKFVDN